MSENKILFEDILKILKQKYFNEINDKDFNNYLKNNIIISNYIPISTKYTYIELLKEKLFDESKAFDSKKDLYDLEYICMEYEIDLVFDILFKYTNIIIADYEKDTENYDLVMSTGLYDFIIACCEKDYKRFIDECDKIININDILTFNSFKDIFNNIPNENEAKNIVEAINNIDTDKLELLKEIQKYNNSTLKKVIGNK